jgi:hypothetical protein
MIKSLTPLTDEEVQRSIPTDDEAGFGSLATERGEIRTNGWLLEKRLMARYPAGGVGRRACKSFLAGRLPSGPVREDNPEL